MRVKTVLMASVLLTVVLAVAVLGPDMSDAESERWTCEEKSGVTVEYSGGDKLTVRLDADPGPEMYYVCVDGKDLSASGKDVIVNLGEPLSSSGAHLIVVHGTGWSATCKVRLATFYTVSVAADPVAGGSVTGAGEYIKGAQTTLSAVSSEGYLFDGWYLNGEKVSGMEDYSITVNADAEYTAKFVFAQTTITFDSNGGSAVASITQTVGTDVKAPEVPVKEGYTFLGWEPSLPSIMPAGDRTLVAQWEINTYTITFDTLGGSVVAAISQAYGTAVTAPADPTKEGFTFVKWNQKVPETVPAKDMTIAAIWAKEATVDGSGKAEAVLDGESDAVIIPSDTKSVTVTMDEKISVVIGDASAIAAGTAIITKVEEIPNTAEVHGTAHAYEVTITEADDKPFTGKMQVTLPYTPEKGKVPVVYWQDGSVLEKMNVISHTGTTVTFETTHNSTYVVVAEPVSEESGATFMLYLGILMVVGIALAILVGFNYYRRKA